jgi:uracil-DNA glycosylase family 4
MSRANGSVNAHLMFLGEAPGRLGADRTAIPFHGDKAGDNFEKLLENAKLSRSEIFVSNAVLCNPKDLSGNNRPPSRSEVANCAQHLKRSIDILQPKILVSLGATALEATRLVESHSLTISRSVRTANKWYGRTLIPLYHPGARAMVHRSFANQVADYYFVGEMARRLDVPKRAQSKTRGSAESWAVVGAALNIAGALSLFQLHKALFLIDYRMRERFGYPATNFYYVRQKDGPYCVELGGRWFEKFPELKVVKSSNPRLVWNGLPLLAEGVTSLPEETRQLVIEVVEQVRAISEAQLKTKVYLTQPMKSILRAERSGAYALNYPIFQ